MTVPSQGWSPPPSPTPKPRALSASLVAQTYALVLADPAMVGLVALSALASGLAFAAVALPAWIFGHVSLDVTSTSVTGFVLFGVAAWASAFVGILGSATVVAAGLARLDGTPITAREAISVAWSRRRELLAWALVTTLVSLAERLLERFGFAGAVIRLATDVAWSLATMLALPVIIAEGAMPAEAITVSAKLVKKRLGLTVRTIVRFYTPWMIAVLASALLMVGGIVAFVSYRHDVPEWSAAGLIVAVASALGLFGAIAVLTAADAFLDTVLYRHAKGLPVSGIDSALLPAVADPSPFG